METANVQTDLYNLLSKIKSKESEKNLYDHLLKLYETQIEMNDEQRFLDLFEDISLKLKKTDGKYLEEEAEKSLKSLYGYLEEFCRSAKSRKALIEPLTKKEGEEVTPVALVGFVPEYYNLFQIFEWLGISIGEKESYLLTNSLRNLANQKNLPSVTFWGKIYGSEKDYFIAEATGAEAGEQALAEPEQEKRGEDGVNKNIYFVTNDLTSDWTELPDVRPSLLRAARKIRYTFTGNLKRQIISNPHFNGTEKDYLRCQIARISFNTNIIPCTNHFKVPEPEAPYKPLEKNEEAKPLKINDLLNLKNWIHFQPSILKEGRINHFEREVPEGVENPEEFRKAYQAKDPFDKRMKSISDDQPLPSSVPNIRLPAWKMQYVYDDKIYINPNIKLNPEEEDPNNQKDNTANYTIVCIRSLRWPGAHLIRYRNENYNVYFGWGHKFADTLMGEKFVYEDFPEIPYDIEDKEDAAEPQEPVEEGKPASGEEVKNEDE